MANQKQVQKLSPAERAALFAKMTRQNQRMVQTLTGVAGDILSFNLPKTRLLGALKVEVSGVVTITHAATDAVPHEDAPYSFIQRAELNLNNGFSPFSVSGRSLAAYNRTLYRGAPVNMTPTYLPTIALPAIPERQLCLLGVESAVGGHATPFNFTMSMPAYINRRDPVGLLLLQNDETLATVNITLGALTDLFPAAGGYTFALTGNVTVRLISESFNVPSMDEALPDISVMKLVQERTVPLVAGENIIQLPIGVTYRKLGLIVYNATPVRIADAGITSNIDILFNQSDNPYSLSPHQLAVENAEQYGGWTPHGEYCYDFSYQGLTNIGGSRDYIDTEELSEFWLRFTTAAVGTARVWYETLSRLK